ncbi:TPA: hypothetical protein ACGSTF_004720 [Pseudomonas aeruginosa]
MNTQDREELAALFAGMHNLWGVLVRQLCQRDALDVSELLIDLDRLMDRTDLHPMTQAVQADAKETLLGILARGPRGEPVAIRQCELQSVAPNRQSPGFEPLVEDQGQ